MRAGAALIVCDHDDGREGICGQRLQHFLQDAAFADADVAGDGQRVERILCGCLCEHTANRRQGSITPVNGHGDAVDCVIREARDALYAPFQHLKILDRCLIALERHGGLGLHDKMVTHAAMCRVIDHNTAGWGQALQACGQIRSRAERQQLLLVLIANQTDDQAPGADADARAEQDAVL